MSHFTVMVIGDYPEEQLAPYHEFECTGYDNEYVQDIDKTEEVLAEYEEHKAEYPTIAAFCEDWHGWKPVKQEEEPDLEDVHKYGYAVFDDAGNLVEAIDRTNPNAKWDWYQLGGRWTGYFQLKPGAVGETGKPGIMTDPAAEGHADAARKSDIDFDAMRAEARERAAKRYDEFHAILTQHPGTKSFREIRAEHLDTKVGLEAARDVYHAQLGVKALNKANFIGIFSDVFEEYCVPRDKFLERAANHAVSTYAFVKNGEWVGSGDMGWWGVSTNEVDEDEWLAKFNEMLDSLPDDTLLSVYDCHI